VKSLKARDLPSRCKILIDSRYWMALSAMNPTPGGLIFLLEGCIKETRKTIF
jgi:hypothetical protein